MTTLYTAKEQDELEQAMLTKFSELSPNVTLKTSGVAGTIITAQSYLLEENQQAFEDATLQSHLSTATGQGLDDLAADHNFTRKEADEATSTVIFSRLQPALIDIIIPLGTKVQTTPDGQGNYLLYQTTQQVTLLQDTYQISAPVEAVEGGDDYNVSGGQASTLSNGTGNSEIAFTSKIGGDNGNLITVSVVHTGSLSISVTNLNIVININSGSTTVNQVKTAIEGDLAANNLVSIDTGSGDGTGNIDALSPASLANGIDGEINLISSIISGLQAVNNDVQASGGNDEESDDDFRERVRLGTSENFGLVTPAGYERIARSVTNVSTAKVLTNVSAIATLEEGTGNAGLIFKAKSFGLYGNALSVECLDTGSLSVVVSGTKVTINIDEGVTLTSAVKTALEASANAMALINVEFSSGGDGSSTFAAFVEANLAGGLGANGEAPNEFFLYITENTSDGFPTQALIDEVSLLVNDDENRSPNDIITVASPTEVSISVTANITQYTSGVNESSVRDNVEQNLLDYVADLAAGDDVIVKSLENVIHDTSGVVDFALTVPASNTVIADSEKAKLVSGNITIT